MEDILFPNVWDTGELQDTDRELSWDLLEQIKKAWNASPFRSVFNQYALARHITSCTKFAPFNALCSDMWYSPTIEDIDDVEEASLEAGWKWPWYWWIRGSWVDVVRRWWNKKFPKQEVASFVGTLFSPEYYEILKLGRTIVASINVNSVYWNDVLSDMKLDSLEFGMWWWHATAFRCIDWQTDQIRFLDSVGKRNAWLEWGSEYIMTEAQLRFMNDPKRCIRQDFHFFIPKKIIKMITKDVAEWQRYSEAVKFAIENNIMVWNDGKFRPNDNVSRAELAQVIYNLSKNGKLKE